jgi:hypothetical protein
MTSPEEYGYENERKHKVERFRSTKEQPIIELLDCLEILLEKGTFSFNHMKELMTVKEWMEKVRDGNTIQS